MAPQVKKAWKKLLDWLARLFRVEEDKLSPASDRPSSKLDWALKKSPGRSEAMPVASKAHFISQQEKTVWHKPALPKAAPLKKEVQPTAEKILAHPHQHTHHKHPKKKLKVKTVQEKKKRETVRLPPSPVPSPAPVLPPSKPLEEKIGSNENAPEKVVKRKEIIERQIVEEIQKRKPRPLEAKGTSKAIEAQMERKRSGAPTVVREVVVREESVSKKDIEELKQLIESKSSGKLPSEQVKQLQDSIQELLQKNMLSKSELEQNIRSIPADRVVEGFTRLIGLIEPVRPMSGGSGEPILERFEMPIVETGEKPKKLVGQEKELEKKELVTDFDKILEVVREKGTVRLDELAKILRMNQKSLQEAIDILEESNLIVQEYAAFGAPKIMDIEYVKKQGVKKNG